MDLLDTFVRLLDTFLALLDTLAYLLDTFPTLLDTFKKEEADNFYESSASASTSCSKKSSKLDCGCSPTILADSSPPS